MISDNNKALHLTQVQQWMAGKDFDFDLCLEFDASCYRKPVGGDEEGCDMSLLSFT